MAVSVRGGSPRRCCELKIRRRLAGHGWPQLFSIKGIGALRPALPPPGAFGATFYASGYWDCAPRPAPDARDRGARRLPRARRSRRRCASPDGPRTRRRSPRRTSSLRLAPPDAARRAARRARPTPSSPPRTSACAPAKQALHEGFRIARAASNYISPRGPRQRRASAIADRGAARSARRSRTARTSRSARPSRSATRRSRWSTRRPRRAPTPTVEIRFLEPPAERGHAAGLRHRHASIPTPTTSTCGATGTRCARAGGPASASGASRYVLEARAAGPPARLRPVGASSPLHRRGRPGRDVPPRPMVFSSQLFLFWFLPARAGGLLRAVRGPALAAPPLPDLRSPTSSTAGPTRRSRCCCFSRPASTSCSRSGSRASRVPWAGRGRGRQRAALAALARLEPRPARLLQVRELRGRGLQLADGPARARPRSPGATSCASRCRSASASTSSTRSSYTIDVYRGHVRADAELHRLRGLRLALLAARGGPDHPLRRGRAADRRAHPHAAEKFARGVAMFSFGMAKKVLLANPCGKVADACFDAGSRVRARRVARRCCAYAFQIYFDFSGYSDMAIGLGLMLGFTFPKNFDSPYQQPLDHRVLEPLAPLALDLAARLPLRARSAGTGRAPRRTYVNLMIVMLLGGLWHGASLNFVVWGGIHGACLALERARGRRGLAAGLPAPLQVAVDVRDRLASRGCSSAPPISARRSATSGSMAGVGPVQEGARARRRRRPPALLPALPGARRRSSCGARRRRGTSRGASTLPRAALALALLWRRLRDALRADLQPFHLLHVLMARRRSEEREQQAERELGHTEISRGLARAL